MDKKSLTAGKNRFDRNYGEKAVIVKISGSIR
jgi:hypothetical protein